MNAEIVRFDELESTNTTLKDHADGPDGLTYVASFQTGGRGQRGNSWESKAGKNLLFSMLLHPRTITPARGFELSMVVSLAIVKALSLHGVEARIKWPNDIYAGGDRKICGILIEHTISGGSIESSIVGVGLNVNQKEFISDAPNPVSMINLLGRETELNAILEDVTREMLEGFKTYEQAPDFDGLLQAYRMALWRGDGAAYRFREAATGEIFEARIGDISADGTLSLVAEGADGAIRNYQFKEVEFLL